MATYRDFDGNIRMTGVLTMASAFPSIIIRPTSDSTILTTDKVFEVRDKTTGVASLFIDSAGNITGNTMTVNSLVYNTQSSSESDLTIIGDLILQKRVGESIITTLTIDGTEGKVPWSGIGTTASALPSPTITLSGAVTGNGTMTNLGNVTISGIAFGSTMYTASQADNKFIANDTVGTITVNNGQALVLKGTANVHQSWNFGTSEKAKVGFLSGTVTEFTIENLHTGDINLNSASGTAVNIQRDLDVAGAILIGGVNKSTPWNTAATNASQALGTTASPSFVAITSSVATGTAPLTIASSTKVSNLNVDKLDDYHAMDIIDQVTNIGSYGIISGCEITGPTSPGTTVKIRGGDVLSLVEIEGKGIVEIADAEFSVYAVGASPSTPVYDIIFISSVTATENGVVCSQGSIAVKAGTAGQGIPSMSGFTKPIVIAIVKIISESEVAQNGSGIYMCRRFLPLRANTKDRVINIFETDVNPYAMVAVAHADWADVCKFPIQSQGYVTIKNIQVDSLGNITTQGSIYLGAKTITQAKIDSWDAASGGNHTHYRNIQLTGTQDGSNKDFDRTGTAQSLQASGIRNLTAYRNGMRLIPTTDFSITGVATITFVDAPETGDNLFIDYDIV